MTKTSKTRGPKEEALRAARAEKAGEIPAFLRRTETPEQAEARRAKQAKAEERKRFGESSGLTVKKPPEPIDPKIAKAIARDLKEAKPLRADQEAGGDAAMARAASLKGAGGDVKDFVLRGVKAQKAVDEIIAKATKPAKAKKLSPLLERAVALRNNIETQAKGTTEMPKAPKKIAASVGSASGKGKAEGKSAKPVTEKSVSAVKKQKAAPKSNGKARYDWNGAEEKAAKGQLPPTPDFSAETHKYFRGMLAEVAKLVKAKDLKALKAFKIERKNGSPGAVDRYRKIAIKALTA